MSSFQDTTGEKWEINLTYGLLSRIKKQSNGNFNLLEPTKDELSARLLSQIEEWWEVLWYLVESQAKERAVTAEQFGERMSTTCLRTARDGFFRELIDFFRQLQREDIALALETQMEQHAKAMSKMQERVKTLEAAIDQKMNRTLNSEFGKLQALLESTPEA